MLLGSCKHEKWDVIESLCELISADQLWVSRQVDLEHLTFNPLMLKSSSDIVFWIYDTFDNDFERRVVVLINIFPSNMFLTMLSPPRSHQNCLTAFGRCEY